MRSLTPTEARTRQQSSMRWPNDTSPAPSKYERWSQGVPTVLGDCAANATNSPQQLRACNDNRAPPLKKKHHHHRRSDRQTPGGVDTPDNRRQVSDRASLTPTPHGNTETNEHHNARNRHYLPTHTDFRTTTDKELQEIITEINNQPQKHLNQTTTPPQRCISNLNTGIVGFVVMMITLVLAVVRYNIAAHGEFRCSAGFHQGR